jgi:hypothetical protein
MAQVTINNGDSGSTVRTALNGMFTELYGESNFPQVADYASLPVASSYSGITYEVLSSTGTWLVNRKSAGLYRSNGTTWVYLGDIDTDAANISNTPAGNVSATTVQAAINELDTEKAIAGAITSSGLTMATASVVYRKTASTGAVEVNTLATLKTDLGLTGTNSGDQTTVSGQSGSVANSVTFDITGGAAAGSTYNGSAAKTVDYSTVGAQPNAPRIQTVASASTVTPTFSNDQVNITALAAACQLLNPTGTAVPAFGLVVRIKDNGTARALTYDTQYRAIGVTLPSTTVISKTLYLGMIYNSTDTKWDVVAVAQEA